MSPAAVLAASPSIVLPFVRVLGDEDDVELRRKIEACLLIVGLAAPALLHAAA